MISRSELRTAYVLHPRPYRDSSVLLELLVEGEGRVAAIARLSKKANSARNAILQPFTPISVNLTGKGDLYSLRSAESVGKMTHLTGDRLACGLYLNELLLHLTHRDDQNPGLFNIYQMALASIERDSDLHDGLRRFEIALLNQLGYGLILDHEADSTTPIQPDWYYCYQPELGPIRTNQNHPGSVQGETLLCLSKGSSLEKGQKFQAKQMMQQVISHHLGGKKLRSRELIR